MPLTTDFEQMALNYISGYGGPAPPPEPAQTSLSYRLDLSLALTWAYSDTAHTEPCENGDVVYALADNSGGNNWAIDSDLGTAPPVFADPSSPSPAVVNPNATDNFVLTTPAVATGVFTVVAVYEANSPGVVISSVLLAGSSLSPAHNTALLFYVSTGLPAQATNDANSSVSHALTPANAGIVYFRRNAANHIFVACSGEAEVDMGVLSGTFTFGAINGNSQDDVTSSNVKLRFLSIALSDLAATSQLGPLLTYLGLRFGYTVP